MIQRLFATDPSRPRPLSVMAAGAAISEEDHVVMQEIIHQNLKRLKRIGLLKREDMDKYYETKEKSKQKTLRKPPAEPFPRRMADHIPNDEQLRNSLYSFEYSIFLPLFLFAARVWTSSSWLWRRCDVGVVFTPYVLLCTLFCVAVASQVPRFPLGTHFLSHSCLACHVQWTLRKNFWRWTLRMKMCWTYILVR